MLFFIIRMSHPDEVAWEEHVQAPIAYLRTLESNGTLRASGAIVGAPVRTGFIILSAKDRAEADGLIAMDPFAIYGVIADLRVEQWDPFFGIFAAESSRHVTGQA